MKLWAVKMLFAWRCRLGYWEWDAFRAAWNANRYKFHGTVEKGEGE